MRSRKTNRIHLTFSRARPDSLPDPGIVVHGPERELQDAPKERVGEMHTDALASPRRTCAGPRVRRAEQANEHFRSPAIKRRTLAMAEGTQNEQTFVRPEEIMRPAAGPTHVP